MKEQPHNKESHKWNTTCDYTCTTLQHQLNRENKQPLHIILDVSKENSNKQTSEYDDQAPNNKCQVNIPQLQKTIKCLHVI
jgi:hypothetical protein